MACFDEKQLKPNRKLISLNVFFFFLIKSTRATNLFLIKKAEIKVVLVPIQAANQQ